MMVQLTFRAKRLSCGGCVPHTGVAWAVPGDVPSVSGTWGDGRAMCCRESPRDWKGAGFSAELQRYAGVTLLFVGRPAKCEDVICSLGRPRRG